MISTEDKLVGANEKRKQERIQRFEKIWMTSEECPRIVLESWLSASPQPMPSFTANAKRVLDELSRWADTNLRT